MTKIFYGFRTRGAALLALCTAFIAGGADARTFDMHSDVIGEIALTTTVKEDAIIYIARANDMGYREMRLANPKVDAWMPGDNTEVVVPSLFVLPDAPRDGIVINVPEMRLFYYPATKGTQVRQVVTYPISIGREQWVTPKGMTKVVGKTKDPWWYPPESIRREHAAEGDPLPKAVPPGPENPLGLFALRLGLNGYLIHGTDKPFGIGMRVTHGCIRMYPEDIEAAYNTIPVGATVRIVNEPYKIGVSGGKIYLEVHPMLDEDHAHFRDEFTLVVNLVIQKTKARAVELDWNALKETVAKKDGIPVIIGTADPQAAALPGRAAYASATRP